MRARRAGVGSLNRRRPSALKAAARRRVFGVALLLAPRPLADDAPVLVREPRRGVQRQVRRERHPARLDLLADFVELALALPPRVRPPLGERKLPAPLLDVALEEPGDGRDV